MGVWDFVCLRLTLRLSFGRFECVAAVEHGGYIPAELRLAD